MQLMGLCCISVILLICGFLLGYALAIIKVSGHQHRWLAGGYDLKIGHSLEVDSMVVS